MELDSIFTQNLTPQLYKKGNLILAEGSVSPYIYYIVSGAIKVYNITTYGTTSFISIDTVGDFFPLVLPNSQPTQVQYYYEAFIESSLLQIPRKDFISYLQDSKTGHPKLYEKLVLKLSDYQKRIDTLEQSSASDKLLHTLEYFGHKFGKTLKPDQVLIDIKLTQQEIADFVGLTRETTTIELKKMENKGIFYRIGKRYVLNSGKMASTLLVGSY